MTEYLQNLVKLSQNNFHVHFKKRKSLWPVVDTKHHVCKNISLLLYVWNIGLSQMGRNNCNISFPFFRNFYLFIIFIISSFWNATIALMDQIYESW